jgi:hypothetical protein
VIADVLPASPAITAPVSTAIAQAQITRSVRRRRPLSAFSLAEAVILPVAAACIAAKSRIAGSPRLPTKV